MIKLQCKTCEFRGKEECPYDVMMYNQDGCDYICAFTRPDNLKEFMKVCGCASHSDVVSTQQMIRERLLENVWACIVDSITESNGMEVVPLADLEKMIGDLQVDREWMKLYD